MYSIRSNVYVYSIHLHCTFCTFHTVESTVYTFHIQYILQYALYIFYTFYGVHCTYSIHSGQKHILFQYLEYCKSIRLLHFLFACDTFREVANKDIPNSGFTFPTSPTQTIKSSLQNDALDIYVKFISMNAPHPITLPENIRISVENHISTEDGSIDYRCFDGAVNHVRQVLGESFVPKFHKSSYRTAYQLDVLRKDLCLADILLCEESITHFMEYLEQKNYENHVLFWVSVEAFQEHLGRSGTEGGCKMEDVGDDAIALYDTYLSLQVTLLHMIEIVMLVRDRQRFRIQIIILFVTRCIFTLTDHIPYYFFTVAGKEASELW